MISANKIEDWSRECWTSDEEEILEALYPRWGSDLCEYFGRSRKAVQDKAKEMNVEYNPDLAKQEAVYYRALGLSVGEIADRVDKSHAWVFNTLKEVGIDTQKSRLNKDGIVKLRMDSDKVWDNDVTRSLYVKSDMATKGGGETVVCLEKIDFVRIVNNLADGRLPLWVRPEDSEFSMAGELS